MLKFLGRDRSHGKALDGHRPGTHRIRGVLGDTLIIHGEPGKVGQSIFIPRNFFVLSIGQAVAGPYAWRSW